MALLQVSLWAHAASGLEDVGFQSVLLQQTQHLGYA